MILVSKILLSPSIKVLFNNQATDCVADEVMAGYQQHKTNGIEENQMFIFFIFLHKGLPDIFVHKVLFT